MATKTRKATKKTKTEAKLPLARDLWLASLGFYGRIYDETVDRAETARTEANKFFDELVDRGTTVETETRKALKDVRIDTTGTVEERLQKLRDALPDLPKFPEMPEMPEFPQFKSTRVRELEAEVEGLTKKVNALSRKTSAAKKTAAAKPRQTPARKAA